MVYPFHLPGSAREDKKWAVLGAGVAALCSIGIYRKDGSQVENKLESSLLDWSQMSVLGLTLHTGKLHRQ